MKVIISTEKEDIYNNFVLVDSFKKIRDLEGVDTIIIHTYSDDDFNAGVFISEFNKKGISTYIYINSNPSVTVKMCIEGVGGICIDDEFYLDDEEELIALLEDLQSDDNEVTSLASPSLNIIGDFIQAFARGENRIQAPVYLEQVKQAVTELSVVSEKQQLQITEMGNTALEVFHRASEIIRNINDSKIKIENHLKELENVDTNTSGRAAFPNTINTFTPYKHMGITKILLIKEYTPCRYLTSFALAYLHHIHYIRSKRVKLIFVHLKGACVSKRYDEFTAITLESAGMAVLYDKEIIATNNPKKEILKNLLNKGDDIAIIVDRLYSREGIVSGRGIVKLNAVGGEHDIKKFNLDKKDTITTTVSVPDSFVTIPTVKKYPVEVDTRYSTYNQLMKDTFEQIDMRLGIK